MELQQCYAEFHTF